MRRHRQKGRASCRGLDRHGLWSVELMTPNRVRWGEMWLGLDSGGGEGEWCDRDGDGQRVDVPPPPAPPPRRGFGCLAGLVSRERGEICLGRGPRVGTEVPTLGYVRNPLQGLFGVAAWRSGKRLVDGGWWLTP
jgi:hypothetical protein